MSDKVRFTSVVRRGLRQFLDRKFASHVELAIKNGTAAHLKRGDRLTKGEVEEMRAAIAWIEQEAAPIDQAEGSEEPAAKDAGEGDSSPAQASTDTVPSTSSSGQ